MHPQNEKNLKDAFAGESQAHMKYLAFAEKARREGRPQIAKLFEATAYAEQVHAFNHLQALAAIQTTSDNLAAGIDGETYEFQQMYPGFHDLAVEHGDKAAERSTRFAMEAEKGHAVLYAEAKTQADAGQDAPEADVYVCEVCGHTVLGDAPDICPVCNVKKDKFRKF